VDTPHRGVYDRAACDSQIERSFALSADQDNEVVCFLKLPPCYRIPTPIGEFYEPDFGLVLKRRNLKSGDEREYYFVVETKGTNQLEGRKALTESERWKIKCALKHFDALGIEAQLDYRPYVAPVQDYRADFKTQVPQP
jgi:type III restriction enzyme